MASATATKPKLISTDLREDYALGLATLQPGQKRVDRDKKVLFGVKMLAGTSKNTHGVDGVDGTDYSYDSVARAVHIYEGLKANVDHRDRDKPNKDRSAYDRLGKYRNVRAERSPLNPELGEMFGDLHMIPSHKLTESILYAAENEELNDCFSLSHDARGRGEVRNRRYVITDIPEARCVDVVADGGGTHGLFESKEPKTMATIKLGKVILESKLPLPLRAKLLGLTPLMETECMEGDGSNPDAWKDHLVNAVAVLVKSDDPEAHGRAKKILKMLEPSAELDEIEEGDEDAETQESLAIKEKATVQDKLNAETRLKESREESKQLLLIVGLKTEGPLLEALANVQGLTAKIAYVNELKAMATPAAPAKAATKAPPGAPRTETKTVTESAEPVKTDDLLNVRLS
jgi:hypothetical protein